MDGSRSANVWDYDNCHAVELSRGLKDQLPKWNPTASICGYFLIASAIKLYVRSKESVIKDLAYPPG